MQEDEDFFIKINGTVLDLITVLAFSMECESITALAVHNCLDLPHDSVVTVCGGFESKLDAHDRSRSCASRVLLPRCFHVTPGRLSYLLTSSHKILNEFTFESKEF